MTYVLIHAFAIYRSIFVGKDARISSRRTFIFLSKLAVNYEQFDRFSKRLVFSKFANH